MQRLQQISHWFLMLSIGSHFFCCVLPTVSSLIGLGTSFGLISTQFVYAEWIHEHGELFLQFSAVMLVVGLVSQFVGWRVDCHSTGCSHGACEPKKKRSFVILMIAVALFAINLLAHSYIHPH